MSQTSVYARRFCQVEFWKLWRRSHSIHADGLFSFAIPPDSSKAVATLAKSSEREAPGHPPRKLSHLDTIT
jgi:hypothetical protein